MYHECRLLPVDDDGGFLAATHFARHVVGGEDTREASQVRFALGHAATPGTLRDVTPWATLPRPASEDEAEDHRRDAQGQGELARSGHYGAVQSGHYARNEVAMAHAARLAAQDTVWAPRRAAAARNGVLLLGFECRTRHDPAAGREVLRLVELRSGRLLWSASSSAPRASHLLALSADGGTALVHAMGPQGLRVVEKRLVDGLPEGAVLPGNMSSHHAAVADGWLALQGEQGALFATGSAVPRREFALPAGAVAWGASVTPDGGRVALAAEGGAVWLLDTRGGPPRRFHPHRGLPRGTLLTVALSDDAAWLATRGAGQLALTRLADGVSWPLGRLEDRVLDEPSFDGFVIRHHLPAAFAFVGGRLLAMDGEAPRALPLGEPPAGVRATVSEQGRPGARVPVKVAASAPFDRLMKAARLGAVAAQIRPHHSPAARLKTKPLKRAGWALPGTPRAPALGASRFGGWPDLPAGSAWPQWQGRPMAFLAQIDLAAAHAAQPGLCLPTTGLLSFFIGCGADTFVPEGETAPRHLIDLMVGTEPAQRGGWCVLHTAAGTPLERQRWETSPGPERFAPCAVSFAKGGPPLPGELTVAYGQLPLDEAGRDDYNDLLAQLAPADDTPHDQLMGHPALLQTTPPELMCELASRGQSPWRVLQDTDDDVADIREAAARWGLLLQLTSNPDAGFLWGDGGHFYFYAPRDAMAAGDFSGAWVVFEN